MEKGWKGTDGTVGASQSWESDVEGVGCGSRALVTWGFESEMPYPFNLMALFMNLDEMLDEDYTKGLGRLKQICKK